MSELEPVGNKMGRPRKHNTPYTGDAASMDTAFQEYLSCVADCFGEPYDDRDNRSGNESNHSSGSSSSSSTSLRSVCEEFNISIPKARKLLITAGVYSTEQSRRVAELHHQGKSVAEIGALTGLKRSSVSSYLPYQKYSYKMDECSRHAEDSRKYRERRKSVEELREKICNAVTRSAVDGGVVDTVRTSGVDVADGGVAENRLAESCLVENRLIENHLTDTDVLDTALWQAVIAYQNYQFHTSSGLLFSYTVKMNKNGEYTGELIVSRKEESKTLTRSSIMLAFHKVQEEMKTVDVIDKKGEVATVLIPPEVNGPKAIGQIFGISYVYSLFWKLGLTRVPRKVEDRLKGKKRVKDVCEPLHRYTGKT